MIAETANSRLAARERGALVRQIAARPHAHSDGSQRTYSRVTIDRWLRAWRARGLDALKPVGRSDTGIVRAHPELFAEAAALRRSALFPPRLSFRRGSCPARRIRSRTAPAPPDALPPVRGVEHVPCGRGEQQPVRAGRVGAQVGAQRGGPHG